MMMNSTGFCGSQPWATAPSGRADIATLAPAAKATPAIVLVVLVMNAS
jgi:hypothetical protein